jgi:hypothetical protein
LEKEGRLFATPFFSITLSQCMKYEKAIMNEINQKMLLHILSFQETLKKEAKTIGAHNDFISTIS